MAGSDELSLAKHTSVLLMAMSCIQNRNPNTSRKVPQNDPPITHAKRPSGAKHGRQLNGDAATATATAWRALPATHLVSFFLPSFLPHWAC